MNTQNLTVVFLITVVCLCCSNPDQKGTLVFHEDFNDSLSLNQWQLEGNATISFEMEGDDSYILLNTGASEENTNTRFNFWCLEKFRGDLRFEFRIKAQTDNKSIFYFNVNPTGELGFFDWERTDARNETVGGSEEVELYALNILRDNGTICYFRHLGGNSAKVLHQTRKMAQESGWSQAIHLWEGDRNVIDTYENVFGDAEAWYTIRVHTRDNVIALWVNGVKCMEARDDGIPEVKQDEHGVYTWDPLINGGYIGFRNFVNRKWVAIDYLKVYQE